MKGALCCARKQPRKEGVVTREQHWAQGLRDEVNLHRIGLDRGILLPRLKPLRYHQEITEFAQARVEFMIASKTYGHRDRDGNMVAARLRAFRSTALPNGFPVKFATENIAWGTRTSPADLFDDFHRSDIHRRAIENPGYVYTGIGVAFDEVGGQYYVTDDLHLPEEKRTRTFGPGQMFFCQVFYTPA